MDSGDEKAAQMTNEGQNSTQGPESSRGPTTSIQEVGEAQTSTPPLTINIQPSPSFEVSHLISSPVTHTPNSPPFYLQYKLKKPFTRLTSMDNPASPSVDFKEPPILPGFLVPLIWTEVVLRSVLVSQGDYSIKAQQNLSSECFYSKPFTVQL